MVRINKDILPEDINTFKQCVQSLINAEETVGVCSKSDEIQIQDLAGKNRLSPKITNSPDQQMHSSSYPIRIVKRLQYKRLGRSKRILYKKLTDMGVLKNRPQPKTFFFF